MVTCPYFLIILPYLNFSANLSDKNFHFDLELPLLEFNGDYSIALKLLVKITGSGKFKGSFSMFNFIKISKIFSKFFLSEKSLAKVFAQGTTEDDRTIFKLKVNLKVDHFNFQLESMIGNKIINDNRIFLEDFLVPGLEDSLSQIFSNIVNNILKSSTYEEMFPE
jgi:Haemolymph juvenile hormone binding protein (JHBP)